MDNIVFYLPSCSTCQKILRSLPENSLRQHDIKTEPLTQKQVDELAKLAGSYEALFSRKAQRYQEYQLKEKALTEKDFRHYLLDHYTFLRRPVFIIGGKIFIGNKKETTDAVIAALS